MAPSNSTKRSVNRARVSPTWYFMGEIYPSLPVLDKGAVDFVKQHHPTYTPTTWEAIEAKEKYRAKSDDEPRPIYVMFVLMVPKGQKVSMIKPLYNVAIELRDGTIIWSSALDHPPNIFGTEENPYSRLLIDPDTREPRQATILMSYFAPPV